MELTFCANLSTMFKSMPLHKRLYEAKNTGFQYVEAQFLYEENLDSLCRARIETDLQFKLINSPKGKLSPSEEAFGLACLPGYEDKFMESIKEAVEYAVQLNCPKIHVIAGKKFPNKRYSEEDYYNTYVSNIERAAEYLLEHGKLLVIEPMSTPEDYFLKSFSQAKKIIDDVSSLNIKMLLDVYHMHRLGLNVLKEIPKYIAYTGHIQVSQTPLRHEPSYPGEINYDEVFKLLKQEYCGDIGLEYTPSDRPDSFDWVKKLL